MAYKFYSNKKDNSISVNKLLDDIGLRNSLTVSEYSDNLSPLKIGFQLSNGDEKILTASTHEELIGKIKKDKDLAILACEKKEGKKLYAIHTIFDDNLRNDKDVVIAYLKANPYFSLKDTSWKIKEDYDIALTAVKQNASNYKYVSPEWQDDKNIILAAIKQGNISFEEFSHRIFEKEDMMKEIVKINGLHLKYGTPDIKDNKEIVLNAVANDGNALQYASARLRNDREVVFEAANQNVGAIYWGNEKYQEDITLLCDILPDLANYSLEFADNTGEKIQFIAWLSPEKEQELLAQTEFADREDFGVYELCLEYNVVDRTISVPYALFAKYENPNAFDFGKNLPYYTNNENLDIGITQLELAIIHNDLTNTIEKMNEYNRDMGLEL